MEGECLLCLFSASCSLFVLERTPLDAGPFVSPALETLMPSQANDEHLVVTDVCSEIETL